jgi:hypothetical protein
VVQRRGNRTGWRSSRALACAAGGVGVALVLLAASAAVALAARPVDISGRWGVFTGPYTQTNTIRMNKQTGTFTGPGVGTNGTGYTWTNHGTVTGSSVHWVFGPYKQVPGYTATCDGTIQAGGKKIVGQCSDTFGHPVVRGSWVMIRKGKADGKGKGKGHGTKRCQVPALRGKTVTAAKRALGRAHCGLGGVSKHRSRTVRAGHVIASTPTAGTRHKAGTRVRLVVSRGSH